MVWAPSCSYLTTGQIAIMNRLYAAVKEGNTVEGELEDALEKLDDSETEVSDVTFVEVGEDKPGRRSTIDVFEVLTSEALASGKGAEEKKE